MNLLIRLVVSAVAVFFVRTAHSQNLTVQIGSSTRPTGTWQRLQDFAPVPTNRIVALTNVLSDPMRFYRVTTPLVP